MGLELYSKIEEMFLDKEAAEMLWGEFIEILKKLEVKNVLDIGCGNGDFCLMAKKEGIEVTGIDLSENQVKKARKKGCECLNQSLCEVKGNFEAAVAVFDVVNYLSEKELKEFFECVRGKIEKYFVFDVNTAYAMEDLAIGTLKAEDENRFAVLYSEFENDRLITEITLFEKKDGKCYEKRQKNIIQYYHSLEKLKKISKMEIKEVVPLILYGSDEPEKYLVIMSKN